MSLPDYFFADLPSEATLTETMVQEACLTMKRNRQQYLAALPTGNLVKVLVSLGESWLRPDFVFRKLALEQGPAAGFSGSVLARGVDAFFGELTSRNFESLLEQDLGREERLDELVFSEAEHRGRRSSVATAPEFLVQVSTGREPSGILRQMVLGLLVRSAQFIRCAPEALLLPRLFAHSLYEAEPKLGACLELAAWEGQAERLEASLLEAADCLVVEGGEELQRGLRQRLSAKVRMVAYGERVSFAFVSSRALHSSEAAAVVANAAADVTAWDQLGSLAPHVIYVEDGGAMRPELFAEALAAELARREQFEPRGKVPAAAASAIAARRAIYEVRAAHSPETRHWCSPGSTAWTVVYEADARFQLSCQHRFVYVKGVRNLEEALQSADGVRERVSTVGLAAGADKAKPLALALARWGAERVCPLGQMQQPPLGWRRQGRPALSDLLRWTDFES
jgi:hypothetical protein